MVSGRLYLRTSPPIPVAGQIFRVGAKGLVIIPDESRAWPTRATIEIERNELLQPQRDRRSEPRVPFPMCLPNSTTPSPLRDISATGLRYLLSAGEQVPALGSVTGGDLRLDSDTVIRLRGRVVRCTGREVAITLDPPGLAPDTLELLRRRFLGSSSVAP
jgi:hypothetical protein